MKKNNLIIFRLEKETRGKRTDMATITNEAEALDYLGNLKEKTVMDLIKEDGYLFSPFTEEDSDKNLANGDTPLSEAFEAYKFALKNPHLSYYKSIGQRDE